MTTAAGTWYPPAAGTGGFLLTNPPFAMTATDRIRAAIQRCIEANHEPSDGSDIAAAVLQEAAEVLFPEKPEPIEPIPMTTVRAINHAEHWSAWCALKAAKERLRALALDLNDTDYGNHFPDATKMVSPADALVASARAVLAEGENGDLLMAVAHAVPFEDWDFNIAQIIARGLRTLPDNDGSADWMENAVGVCLGAISDAIAGTSATTLKKLSALPADGEVAELVAWLRETGDQIQPSHLAVHQRYKRAAALLEQRHPTPVPAAEREVQ